LSLVCLFDYYSYSNFIVHSHTAQNGPRVYMAYTALTFTKKSNRLDLLFGFPVAVCQGLDLERWHLAEWQAWRSCHCLLFGRPWPTFATV